MQLPEPRFTYTLALVADEGTGPTHEPTVLPDGYVFVPTRLIIEARDEAEFTGMLAHAMAHVAARHYTRELTRGGLTQATFAPIPAAVRGADVQQTVSLNQVQFTQTFETEADVIAVNILAKAGYDPNGLAEYIRRLSTTDSRVARISQEIERLQSQNIVEESEFKSIQEDIKKITPR